MNPFDHEKPKPFDPEKATKVLFKLATSAVLVIGALGAYAMKTESAPFDHRLAEAKNFECIYWDYESLGRSMNDWEYKAAQVCNEIEVRRLNGVTVSDKLLAAEAALDDFIEEKSLRVSEKLKTLTYIPFEEPQLSKEETEQLLQDTFIREILDSLDDGYN